MAATACACLEPEQQGGSAGAEPPPAETAASDAIDDKLSAGDHALLRGYEAALRSPAIRQASLELLLRQLRHNPPVAFIDGYWATPVDLGAMFRQPVVLAALRPLLSRGEHAEQSAGLLDGTHRPRQLVGIGLTANPLRESLGLPSVGEFARAGMIEPGSVAVYLVPLRDVEWVIVEHLPPEVAPPGIEPECYFFCGDPLGWDSDGDGTPDVGDDDDDNDGAPDAIDDYPYWPEENDSGEPAVSFIGLTTKFSRQVTRAVLTARRRVAQLGEATRSVALGRVAGTDREVRLVVPAASQPSTAAPSADDCPDPGDTRVRYVSEDPAECARVRFRCESGEAPFSNECGCGCAPAS